MPTAASDLHRDLLLVGLYTVVLYAIVLFVGGPLTLHEGVLPQTTKAMLANHDWLVPRYGNAPWLEHRRCRSGSPAPSAPSSGIATRNGTCASARPSPA